MLSRGARDLCSVTVIGTYDGTCVDVESHAASKTSCVV